MQKEQILDWLDISLNDFNNYFSIANNFFIPPKLKRFYSLENINECFLNISTSIFSQIDLLVGLRISWAMKQSRLKEEFINLISDWRHENLKKAIYEEINFRILSNSFPEFNNKQELLTSGLARVGFSKDYSNIESMLCPTSAGYVISCAWNKLDINPRTDFLNYYEFLENSIKDLKNQMLNNDNFDRLQQTLIESTKSKLLSEIDLKTSKTEFNEFQNNVNSNLDEIDANINKIDLKQQKQEAKIDNLNTSITEINQIANTNKQINDSQKLKLNQLVLSLEANTSNDAETLRKFNELSTKYQEKLVELQAKETEQNAKISENSTELQSLKLELANLDEENQRVAKNLGSSNKRILKLEEGLSNYYTKPEIDAKLANETGSSDSDSNLNSKLDELKNEINTIKQNYSPKSKFKQQEATANPNNKKVNVYSGFGANENEFVDCYAKRDDSNRWIYIGRLYQTNDIEIDSIYTYGYDNGNYYGFEVWPYNNSINDLWFQQTYRTTAPSGFVKFKAIWKKSN